jgi:hypothetical protein
LAHRAGDQPLPVLGEHRRVPHRIIHLQTHKPAEQKVVVQLFHQLTLRTDRVQNHQQLCPQQSLRRNRRTARCRIQLRQLAIHPLQCAIHQRSYLARRVIRRDPLLHRHVTEHPALNSVATTHTLFLTQVPVDKK